MAATLISEITALRDHLARQRSTGGRLALVPTMGALHEGHLALIDSARQAADLVVVSIFVNPLQFRPGEDLARYPRQLEQDVALAEARGADVIFAPAVEEMYAQGEQIRVVAGELASRWEGASRPGHFDGVLTVVAKLFNIVQPDLAVFGRKDLQQATLIARMIAELNFPVELVLVPTVRDADGVALSSRNAFLSPAERELARRIPASLAAADAAWRDEEQHPVRLEAAIRNVLGTDPALVIDYIAVVDPDRLEPVETVVPGTVIAVAVRVGTTRLIDNTVTGE